MRQIKVDEVIAVIPARSGSKGIKNKNIVELKGFPLFTYSIATAKLCKSINRILVSTDSEEYAKIAKEYGAEVPFLRPTEISQSQSKDIEYLRHALLELARREKKIPEYIALLRPTTPLRDAAMVDKAIEQLKERQKATALVSVHYTEECPYKWMVIGKTGYLESPFSTLEPDDVNLPRQSFPSMLIPDGYIDVLKSEVILEKGCVYGSNAIPYLITEKVIDVDTKRDFEELNSINLDNLLNYQYLRQTCHN